MSQAKVRSLNVRPIQSADLSFNLSGIIDFRNDKTAQLGMRINKFDLTSIYKQLNIEESNGRLKFDGEKIRNIMQADTGAVLFSMRNNSIESLLVHAIYRRQNAFLQRYKHKISIIKEYEKIYNTNNPDSKHAILTSLYQRTKEYHIALKKAYETEVGMDGVVSVSTTKIAGKSDGSSTGSTVTSSESTSDSSSVSKTTSSGKSNESSISNQTGDGTATTNQRPLAYRSINQISKHREGDDLANQVKYRIDSENSESHPLVWNEATTKWEEIKDVSFKSQETKSVNTAKTISTGESSSFAASDASGSSNSKTISSSKQDGQNTNNSTFSQEAATILTEFRHPSAENDLRWYRKELELQDERLSSTLIGFQMPEMETILSNELLMLDQEVRQLQLNYLHTFLTPSISGLVTAIYKDMGEFVAAGEPVMRVEDDQEILLVGVVNHRAPLNVGLKAVMKIRNPYEQAGSSEQIELNGYIAAVRGHSADNDEWEIIIRANNTVPGTPAARRLPLNYVVQREDVELKIG